MKPSELENATITVNTINFTHKDIHTVVDTFYYRVQNDPLLQVPFQSVHDWPEHIERLTHFWWIKFGGKPYLFSFYNPVQKHFYAGFNRTLLAQWLGLFHEVLREKLTDEQYKLWALISERMGESLSIKNEMYRQEIENE